MNQFRNSNNAPLEVLEQNIFSANRLSYIVLKTNAGGILLRTLDTGEYVSHYPERIYRFDSDYEQNIPLLFLDENSDYEKIVEAAEKIRQVLLKTVKKSENEAKVKDGFRFRLKKTCLVDNSNMKSAL